MFPDHAESREGEMKITFVTASLTAGGAERNIVNIANSACRSGLDVEMINLGSAEQFRLELSDEIKYTCLQRKKVEILTVLWKLFFFGGKEDIVFLTHSRIVSLATLLRFFSGKYRGPKIVSRLQGMPSFEKNLDALVSPLKQKIYRLGYRASDLIVAQTEEMRSDVCNVYGIAERKVITLHNSVCKISVALAQKSERPSELRGGEYYNIVASGRLAFEKGFDILLKACATPLLTERVVIHVIGNAVGTGFDQHLIELSNNNAMPKVIFHGFKNNPLDYYYHSDLVVVPSRWEGCPNVVLECMALGVNIISSRTVAILDEFSQHYNGLKLVNVEDVEDLRQALVFASSKKDSDPNLPFIFNEFDEFWRKLEIE